MSQETVDDETASFLEKQRERDAERMAVGVEVTRAMLELRIRIIDRLGFDPGSLENTCSRAMADINSQVRRPCT